MRIVNQKERGMESGGGGFLGAAIAASLFGWAIFAHGQVPIRIGASLSITGTYAELGQTHERAYRVCLKQVNDRGGILGRRVELVVQDDKSEVATSLAIYEKLIARDKVDLVFSPYSSPLTDAVADMTEKYRMPMIAAGAATTSIFRKGRKYLFMLLSPAEDYLEGTLDMAAKRGLKTVAILYEDTQFPKAIAQGAAEAGKKRGLNVVLIEGYPRKTADFSAILNKVKTVNPDVLAAATYFDDSLAIIRQSRDAGVNPSMTGVTVGGDLPKFYQVLGGKADYVYGASQWEPDLVTMRAGGLIPIARLYPGAREFVEEHHSMFPSAGVSYQTAAAYAACTLLTDAIRKAGAVDHDRIRDAIAKFDGNTAFGAFRVDAGGFQIAHKMLAFQWQGGKKVIVWPEELAAEKPVFPTPPWNQRP
jgi:branched-chain amino acid transport system substrate-binding protein